MTAFYVFRALFLAFFGEYRGEAHAHESPAVMTLPLAVLAVLSLAGGYFAVPRFLEPVFPLAEEPHDFRLVAISVAAGLGGIALAWLFYVRLPALPGRLAKRLAAALHAGLQQVFRGRDLRRGGGAADGRGLARGALEGRGRGRDRRAR